MPRRAGLRSLLCCLASLLLALGLAHSAHSADCTIAGIPRSPGADGHNARASCPPGDLTKQATANPVLAPEPGSGWLLAVALAALAALRGNLKGSWPRARRPSRTRSYWY